MLFGINGTVTTSSTTCWDLAESLNGIPPIDLGGFMESLPKFYEVNNA